MTYYIDKYRQDRRTVVDNTEMFASDILANKTDTRMYKVYIHHKVCLTQLRQNENAVVIATGYIRQ